MMCAILVLFPLCFFGGQFLLGQFVSQTEYYTLESTTINLPFARLSDVEHSADLVLDHETSDVSTYWDGIQQSIIATMNAHYAEKQDSDWMSKKAIAHGISSPGAYYETWQNSVVRCRFDTHESGVVVGKNWPNGDRPYNPWITSRVYQLRIPVLQRFLVQDLIHEYGVTVTGKYLTKAYKSSVFNELYVSENGATKELFGYKGGTVVYSLYEGTAGMDEFVKAAESRISK